MLLSTYVCMYVCVIVCIYVSIYVCMYLFIYINFCGQEYVFQHLRMYARMCVCM